MLPSKARRRTSPRIAPNSARARSMCALARRTAAPRVAPSCSRIPGAPSVWGG